MDSAVKIDILWINAHPPDIFETQFSYKSCREISKKFISSAHTITSWTDYTPEDPLENIFQSLSSGYLIIISSPEIIVSSHAAFAMKEALDAGHSLCLPVYNETPCANQQADLPHAYLNVSTYQEVSAFVQKRLPALFNVSTSTDFSCFMVKTDWFMDQCRSHHLKTLSDILSDINGFIKGCNPKELIGNSNALVHSFGNYYSGERDQLADMVPLSAKTILDIGTARGGFGKTLRQQRPDCRLTGVEMNKSLAADAEPHYDVFYISPFEKLNFASQFDHINCGEFVEHVYDPWLLLDKCHEFLKPEGTLCLSLPNAGHWTIVKELLAGECQYIAIGLQCVTHIRWFTESSIKEALKQAGFKIEEMDRLIIPPTPEGEAFIQHMCDKGYGLKENLLTFNMIIKAIKT